MLMLALAFLAAFFVSYLPDVSPQHREDARFVENVIIAIFAADLIVRLALAERRLRYLRYRWLDILIIIVPFLRPLRLLMFLPMLMRVIAGLQRIMGPFQGAYVLVAGLITVFTSAGMMLVFEENSDGPIQTFDDALWWAITTITTVGYGDTFPVTSEGRALAAGLMVVGISLFGVLTAGIAAYLVESATEEGEDEQSQKLDEILRRLEALEKSLEETDETKSGGDT
jgi:voltage-gated potassium channel